MCKNMVLGQICPKSTSIKFFKVAKIDWIRHDENLKQVMLRMFRQHILMWCWDCLDLTIFGITLVEIVALVLAKTIKK